MQAQQKQQQTPTETKSPATTAVAPPANQDAVSQPRTRHWLWRLAWGARVTLALALIVLSLWSLLLPVSVPISSAAAVTARVAAVATPIRGEVKALNADAGDVVRAGQPLAEISNAASSQEELLRLRAERANLDVQKEAISAELKQSEQVRTRYDARYKDYGTRIVREAQRLAEEAQSSSARWQTTRKLRAAELEDLQAQHAPPREIERARLEVELAEKETAAEAARASRYQTHIDDAKAGFRVAPGVESPLLSGLPADLELRVARLLAERERLTGVAVTLDSQIKEAERAQAAAAKRTIESPVNGVVWARPVNVGQFVDGSEHVFRIADQRTLHVQAYFHRRYIEGMAIGNKASVYLVAARTVVKGTVKIIQSVGGGVGRDEYAIDLPSPDDEHFRVVIELNEQGRRMADIGGLAKVAVMGGIDNELQRSLLWLYLRFES